MFAVVLALVAATVGGWLYATPVSAAPGRLVAPVADG